MLVLDGDERVITPGGWRDVAHHAPMTADTIFRIYSMTKPITSVATMMLVEQGWLRLDDPVAHCLDSFRDRHVVSHVDPATGRVETTPAKATLTIRHLLTHTSGIGYRYLNPTVLAAQKFFAKSETELPLAHEPGTRWTYGASTKVLGDIIAKVSGQSLDQFLTQRILEPLGMSDTSFRVPDSKVARVATTHQRTAGELIEKPNPTPLEVWVRGDYGLYSTAYDYSLFVKMLMRQGLADHAGTRLLSQETVREMTSNQIGDLVVEHQPSLNADMCRDAFPVIRGRDKFGFGFQMVMPEAPVTGRRPAGSYGWSGVMNTYFWIDPDNQVAVILLTQILPSHDAAVLEMLDAIEEALYS